MGSHQCFILIDQRVLQLHHEYLQALLTLLPESHIISIHSEEKNKEWETLLHCAEELLHNGASRQSHLFAIGGGVTTDLSAFLASIYMRGVSFSLIPTTLLAMVDASVGGKTGINLNGVKNILGTFCPASYIFCDITFLNTLTPDLLLDGYGELVKHALLQDRQALYDVLRLDPTNPSSSEWSDVVKKAVDYKSSIVVQDPMDRGIRQYLNFGHTFGHAFEAFALQQSNVSFHLSHGAAVAAGLVCELFASVMKGGLSSQLLYQYIYWYRDNYPRFSFTCKQYERLFSLMVKDKKNISSPELNQPSIQCVLLKEVGNPLLTELSKQEIYECFDFYREAL